MSILKGKFSYKSFICGVIITGIVAAGLFLGYNKIVYPKMLQSEVDAIIGNGEGAQLTKVYRLSADVLQGQPIPSEVLVEDYVLTEQCPIDSVMSLEEIEGMVTRANLTANSRLYKSQLSQAIVAVTDGTRTQDFDYIKLNVNLLAENYVDIMYRTEAGEEYVVASKLKVKEILGSSMICDIEQTDRMYISNASVEASINNGLLYTTIYTDPQNQDKAKITYALNETIQKMIEKDPNIVRDAQEKLKEKNGAEDNSTTQETVEPKATEGEEKSDFLD